MGMVRSLVYSVKCHGNGSQNRHISIPLRTESVKLGGRSDLFWVHKRLLVAKSDLCS